MTEDELVPVPPKPRFRRFLMWAGGTLLASALLVGLQINRSAHQQEMARRVECAVNMREVGVAILEHGAISLRNGYAATLDDVQRRARVPFSNFCCPGDNARPAMEGPLVFGETLSYLYLDYGLEAGLPNDLLLVEPLRNHKGEGANVFFRDGLVRFIAADQLAELLQPLIDSGRVPPGTDMSQFLPPGR